MSKKPSAYVAGPMSWIPQFNFPAFDAAAKDLRKRGYKIISPAELDDPASRKRCLASVDGNPNADINSGGETWGDLLARDIKIVADMVESVIVIPGWEGSKGARLETYVARLCDKPVYYYSQRSKLQRVSIAKLNAVHIGDVP